MEREYKDYYLRTICAHQTGIKLVLGGTGLGKTHGMREAIIQSLHDKESAPKKFIYITNRHNLITEQQRILSSRGVRCSYLKSNKEVVREIYRSNVFDELIESLESANFFKYDEQHKTKERRRARFNKILEGIKTKLFVLESEKQKNSTFVQAIERELNLECEELFKIFKYSLIQVARQDKQLHSQLLSNSFVWRLFPYVEFENNPESNVLLVTVQKVLRGFFDGKKDVKIASIDKKIVFLDEFDFLEQEILKILCDEPSIINPLEFVRIFYEKFKHWSKADFWSSSSELTNVHEMFSEIIEYIDSAMTAKRLTFPGVLDFRLNEAESGERPYMLFQTNEIITPRKFFLREESNSWFIQNDKTKDTVSPFELFNVLTLATTKILGVFHYFQDNQNLVSEIIQAIWNQKNDNIGGSYEDYIIENCIYHRSKPKGVKSELYKDKSPYEIGFRLVKLIRRSTSFDPNSAELSQIELFTSPESVIAKLSDNNLVFALSATTDIPRTLKCFNIQWLTQNTNYIALDQEDREIIKSRRDTKSASRRTTVTLRIADELSEEHPIGQICKGLHKKGFFGLPGDSDRSDLPRYQRVMRVLGTMQKCISSNKHSHLIFVETFGQLREIVDYKHNENHLYFAQLNRQTFDSTRYGNSSKYFSVILDGKQVSILFLNSDDARQLQEGADAIRNYRDCFLMKDHVIVITQYKSASNGVNLPCFGKMGSEECDFEGIHLLDQNNFWFDDGKDASDFKNHEKQALWYLWKLKDAGQIDSGQFNACLSARDPKNNYKIDIAKINKLYKEKADEKTLNAIALYHQALGRIERRKNEVPQVEVTLDRNVFNDFYLFLKSENFASLTESRRDITSDLILKVQDAVVAEGKKLNVSISLAGFKSFENKNTGSREVVKELLAEIEKVKGNYYDDVVSKEVKMFWIELRDAILRHDFEKRIKAELIGKTVYLKRDFMFETKFIDNEKNIVVDVTSQKVFREAPPGRKITNWNLDIVYKIVRQNPMLKHSFNNAGYKTEFEVVPGIVNHILTPYTYQALLAGAVGEQAISFLLKHHGIPIVDTIEMENEIFEVVDAKVMDANIFFDFKNFSTTTLDKFALGPDDINFDMELNSKEFLNKIQSKFAQLKDSFANPILYVVNLYSDQFREPIFLNNNFVKVNYEKDSCIRIIPTVLNPKDPSKISPEFESMINLLSIHETQIM